MIWASVGRNVFGSLTMILQYLWRLELQGSEKSCPDRKSLRDFRKDPVAQPVSPFTWSCLSLALQASGPTTF